MNEPLTALLLPCFCCCFWDVWFGYSPRRTDDHGGHSRCVQKGCGRLCGEALDTNAGTNARSSAHAFSFVPFSLVETPEQAASRLGSLFASECFSGASGLDFNFCSSLGAALSLWASAVMAPSRLISLSCCSLLQRKGRALRQCYRDIQAHIQGAVAASFLPNTSQYHPACLEPPSRYRSCLSLLLSLFASHFFVTYYFH